MRRAVELMTVSDQHTAAFRGAMHKIFVTFDRAEESAHHLGAALVMIAGQKNHPGPAPAPRPQLLDDGGLSGIPAPSRPYVPSVDHVTDQEEVFGAVAAQKFEQRFSLASHGAEMEIRNPDGAVVGASARGDVGGLARTRQVADGLDHRMGPLAAGHTNISHTKLPHDLI